MRKLGLRESDLCFQGPTAPNDTLNRYITLDTGHCGNLETCWRGHESVRSLGKTIWYFLKILNIRILYNPEMPSEVQKFSSICTSLHTQGYYGSVAHNAKQSRKARSSFDRGMDVKNLSHDATQQ